MQRDARPTPRPPGAPTRRTDSPPPASAAATPPGFPRGAPREHKAWARPPCRRERVGPNGRPSPRRPPQPTRRKCARPPARGGAGAANHPAGTSIGAAEKEGPASHRPGRLRGRALVAEAGRGLVDRPRRGLGLAASSGVLRGGAARAEGVAGARPSLPWSAGARKSPAVADWDPGYPGRSGRAAVQSEVKRPWRARVSWRRGSGEARQPARARGSAWAPLRETRGPDGTKAGRGGGAPRAFASILRTVQGGGERRGGRWRRAGAACGARGAAHLAAGQLCAR